MKLNQTAKRNFIACTWGAICGAGTTMLAFEFMPIFVYPIGVGIMVLGVIMIDWALDWRPS